MKRLIVLLPIFGLVAAFAADTNEENTLTRVLRQDVLVAGVVDDDPPFGIRDEQTCQLIGYDIDVVAALARRLGVDLRLRTVTTGDRLSDLIEGRIDILAAGLTRSEARKTVIDFTDAYLISGQKLIARTGAIRRPEDLVGKRLGTVVGTFAEACAGGRCYASIIVPFDDYIAGIKALEKGSIDAFTADEAILADLFEGLQGGGYEIPDVFILKEEYCLGVRKHDRDFLSIVNRTLSEMGRDGEIDRIRARWFAPQAEVPPPAYGSVVRKASVPPRFLGVVLNGILYPNAEVEIFAMNGEYVGKGRVSTVLGDEFYVDVDEGIYDLVCPGFLVAMNMNSEMAMDVLMRRKQVLETVKEQAEQHASEVEAQIEAEAKAKEERAIEMDTYREKMDEAYRAADRVRYDRYRYYYRRRFRP